MKLEMTLPERPGFLHALPLFDLLVLLVLLLILGPMFLSQRGLMVEAAPSRFQMERFQGAPVVVTLGRGDVEPRLHLGRQPVGLAGLAEGLDRMLEEDGGARRVVLLKTDVGTSVGVEREVTELILGKGFRVGLVGRRAGDEGLEEEVEE